MLQNRLEIRFTSGYKKAYKRLARSGKVSVSKIDLVLDTLAEGKGLSEKYRDHALSGEFLGKRECHILPDLLLVYYIEDNKLILVLVDIGNHSQLFD